MTTSAAFHPADVRVVPEEEFCDRLARAMRHASLKTGDVAEYLRLNPATVSRWLGGRTLPNRATMIALADLAGVDLDWLEMGQAPAVPGPAVVRHQGLEPRTRWIRGFAADQRVSVTDLAVWRAQRAVA